MKLNKICETIKARVVLEKQISKLIKEIMEVGKSFEEFSNLLVKEMKGILQQ